jgi:hypothetical protein
MTAVAPALRTRCAASNDQVRPYTSWPRALRTLISSVPMNPAAPVMNVVAGRSPVMRPVSLASARATTDSTRTELVQLLNRARPIKRPWPGAPDKSFGAQLKPLRRCGLQAGGARDDCGRSPRDDRARRLRSAEPAGSDAVRSESQAVRSLARSLPRVFHARISIDLLIYRRLKRDF